MRKRELWKILYYLIIYSFLGFIIETIYAIFTKGTLESRQSFLYGPFCVVYGIAAIVLIYSLKKYKYQNAKLFIYGMMLGCLVEYLSSLIGEILLHAIWWDYSNDFLNINGRTCLYYAVLWGFLSILLINWLNPKIDRIYYFLIKIINRKGTQTLIGILSILFVLDSTLTCFALENFLVNVSKEYNINIKGIENIEENKILSKYFTNEKMMMVYPNIIVVTENDDIIYLESILGDIRNYYYKFGKK